MSRRSANSVKKKKRVSAGGEVGRLTKNAKQWAEIIGIDPQNMGAVIRARALEAVDIAVQEVDKVIQEELAPSGHAGSLKRYKAAYEEDGSFNIDLGGEKVAIPKFRVFVKPPQDHAALNTNVFDILDSGREAMPRKPSGRKGWYTFWSWEGSSHLKIAVQRGRGYKKTGIVASKQTGTAARTPIRPEPRRRGRYYAEMEPEDREIFFSKGPVRPVPGRYLYARIMKNIKKKLKNEGFDSGTVSFSSKD